MCELGGGGVGERVRVGGGGWGFVYSCKLEHTLHGVFDRGGAEQK